MIVSTVSSDGNVLHETGYLDLGYFMDAVKDGRYILIGCQDWSPITHIEL